MSHTPVSPSKDDAVLAPSGVSPRRWLGSPSRVVVYGKAPGEARLP